MFERFTERARQVLVFAQEEAHALKHDYIGTEHLLLGLLRETDGGGPPVLGSFAVTLDGVGALILREVGAHAETVRAAVFDRRGGRGYVKAFRDVRPASIRAPFSPLAFAGLLAAFALGAGLLIGWAIWG